MLNKKSSQDKYLDYRRGWIVGAQNLPTTSEIGTTPPTYADEFERGHSDGQEAFRSAMARTFTTLQFQETIDEEQVVPMNKEDTV